MLKGYAQILLKYNYPLAWKRYFFCYVVSNPKEISISYSQTPILSDCLQSDRENDFERNRIFYHFIRWTLNKTGLDTHVTAFQLIIYLYFLKKKKRNTHFRGQIVPLWLNIEDLFIMYAVLECQSILVNWQSILDGYLPSWKLIYGRVCLVMEWTWNGTKDKSIKISCDKLFNYLTILSVYSMVNFLVIYNQISTSIFRLTIFGVWTFEPFRILVQFQMMNLLGHKRNIFLISVR